ncbi:MAG: UDP-diphospho-muramoylpentapeptide beta-N-acetylglucosaminyltransferase [Clostridiales bacterium]|jgi:UDP-N-acetylglucosamine:LPS N-acetylglucosamine transferase|nr:UDP-diphospho-muramoylpentapeptide beta-N-acetylglucosaminyltransferase [Clostridiales bacterium]
MSKRIDVVILSAKFGNGHISVTNAIKQNIIDNLPELNVWKCDFYRVTNPKTYKAMYSGYRQLVKNARHVFNAYYYAKENLPFIGGLDTLSSSTYKATERAIERFQPRVIISTFPVVSGYVSKYKEKTGSRIPLITVITDIVSTNEWIYPETDYYCVATPEIKEELMLKQIQSDRILVTGIPIRKEFYEYNNDLSIECIKDIPKENKVITFVGGGLGILPDKEEDYEWLDQISNATTVIVTGNNDKLYQKLKEELVNKQNIIILGFTTKVHEILRRTDILVAKPGGITLFEAIVSEVPTIILKPTLGQEKENCKYIKAMQLGIVANSPKELRAIIESMIEDEDKLQDYKENLKYLKSRLNPEELVKTIEKLLEN